VLGDAALWALEPEGAEQGRSAAMREARWMVWGRHAAGLRSRAAGVRSRTWSEQHKRLSRLVDDRVVQSRPHVLDGDVLS
jgi:hypothetical protein